MTRYCLKGDNPHQSLRFILFCPGDRHFDVESSLIFQKDVRVALGMVVCWCRANTGCLVQTIAYSVSNP